MPFLPQQPIRENGDIAHVNAAAYDAAGLPHGLERRRNQGTDRGKQDRCVERLGRLFVRATYPASAETLCVCLRNGIARTREGIDIATLPATDLGDDVGRSTK